MRRKSNRVCEVSFFAAVGVFVAPTLIATLPGLPSLRSAVGSVAMAAVYTESGNGDLSGDRFEPTSIALDLGSNTISATSVAGDLEYFRISMPVGARLTSVTLGEYSSATSVSFIAVQSGTTFTQPPAGTMVGQLLGWTHFGNGALGTDILDNMGTGSGAIGFTGPLPHGSYTFWAQETAGAPASYTLTFSVAAAPAPVPATGWVGACVLGLLLLAIAAVYVNRWGGPRPSRAERIFERA